LIHFYKRSYVVIIATLLIATKKIVGWIS